MGGRRSPIYAGRRGRGTHQSLKNETRDTDKITPSFLSSATVSAASPSALKVGHYGAPFKCGWELEAAQAGETRILKRGGFFLVWQCKLLGLTSR